MIWFFYHLSFYRSLEFLTSHDYKVDAKCLCKFFAKLWCAEQNCYVGTNYISVGNKQDTSLDNSLALKCTLTTYISSRPSNSFRNRSHRNNPYTLTFCMSLKPMKSYYAFSRILRSFILIFCCLEFTVLESAIFGTTRSIKKILVLIYKSSK